MKFFRFLSRKIKYFLFDFYLFIEFIYDFKQFRKNYARTGKNEKDYKIHEARIILYYHVLEKGLSHPEPKEKFGLETAMKLIEILEDYFLFNFPSTDQVIAGIEVLVAYTKAPTIKPFIDKTIIDRVSYLRERHIHKKIDPVGAIELSKTKFFSNNDKPFSEFARSRRSCRQFTKSEIPKKRVFEAVDIARISSPSVCNRQTCKVHHLTKKVDILNHLKLQEGNRGFGEKIENLLLVTSDLRLFVNVNEKNQAFVDGGIFTMSLLFALHSVKLGAVPLNWCYNSKQDRALKKLGFVSESEKLILMIGIGNVPDYFSVPASVRRPLREILESY